MPREARAFWVRSPGVGEIRAVPLPDAGRGEVQVRTLRSGVSRGTESLVFSGRVPPDQWHVMRAPFQDGEFPGPVKYGYLSVGVVEQGPDRLAGRTVFCLYPHQTAYVVPESAVVVVPQQVPPARAVLAGMMETAVNALWDAPPLIGDRAAVVGGGLLGCCVAHLLSRIPGVSVTVVDVDPSRARVATALGARFAAPEAAPADCDLVVHTSATGEGLQQAMDMLAPDTAVLDLSWYGTTPVTLPLGGAYHSRRLGIRASQVGLVAPARRGRRSPADRLALAMDLLADPALDCLLTGVSPFEELPSVMARIAGGHLPGLCHGIDYGSGPTGPIGAPGAGGAATGAATGTDTGTDTARAQGGSACSP